MKTTIPGVALRGFPIQKGLFETELGKLTGEPERRRNIERTREYLSTAGLLHTPAGRKLLKRRLLKKKRAHAAH